MDTLFSPINLLALGILVYSAILHEIAHGFVAEKLGDPTARLLGRLTLDPRPHIDIFLSIILPLLLILSQTGIIFGGAKPVPVDPFNLKEGRKDIALVSLAGPATNILVALLFALLAKLLFPGLSLHQITTASIGGTLITIVISINLWLAIFNLLPIPPLDGSKIFALILPEQLSDFYLSLSSIGTLILLFLLMFPIGGFSLITIVADIFRFSIQLLGL